MNTIEVADCNDGVPERNFDLVKVIKNFHGIPGNIEYWT
jgi:hypothetical protein